MEELTLEKFEEAYEEVRKITSETKLVYSEYFSDMTGNKARHTGDKIKVQRVFLKPDWK